MKIRSALLSNHYASMSSILYPGSYIVMPDYVQLYLLEVFSNRALVQDDHDCTFLHARMDRQTVLGCNDVRTFGLKVHFNSNSHCTLPFDLQHNL